MKFKTCAAVLAIATVLASCGGGGSGGSVTPPPPVPAPPPPPPPPPPPTPTVRTFALGTGPAFFNFFADDQFPGNDPTFSGGYGTRDGFYFPGFLNGFRSVFFGTGAGTDQSGRAKVGQFVDAASSIYLQTGAPQNARVITPVTTLLILATDQGKLKRQLGISGSLFGLQSIDPDLLTFDAVLESASTDPARRADAARLLAANARVLAVGALLESGDRFTTVFELRALGGRFNSAPDQFIFTNTNMSALIASIPGFSNLRPEVVSAMAHVVNAYVAAIGIQINDSDAAARFLMGIRGFLIPEIRTLVRSNSVDAANAALQISAPQILAEISRYNERVPFNQTGFFFPAPDFFEISRGGTLIISPNTGNQTREYPTANDFNANGPTGAIGFFPNSGTGVLSVSVPSLNANEVSAVLNPDASIRITAAPGFAGVTYFDYTNRSLEGEVQTGRVYVKIR